MNKKEQQAMVADLERQLREARALRFLDTPMPDRMPIPKGGEYVNGWNFYPYEKGSVYPAWTQAVFHGRGHRDDDGGYGSMGVSASQGGRALFASRLDALIALRITKTAEYAKRLAELDAEIESERESVNEGAPNE